MTEPDDFADQAAEIDEDPVDGLGDAPDDDDDDDPTEVME